tara:strand:- start:17068 stop:17601 length:534 start_codon:yes stop_codon:yes gene_type:complete
MEPQALSPRQGLAPFLRQAAAVLVATAEPVERVVPVEAVVFLEVLARWLEELELPVREMLVERAVLITAPIMMLVAAGAAQVPLGTTTTQVAVQTAVMVEQVYKALSQGQPHTMQAVAVAQHTPALADQVLAELEAAALEGKTIRTVWQELQTLAVEVVEPLSTTTLQERAVPVWSF